MSVLASTAGAGPVTLLWQASAGATGYEIEQSVDNAVSWTLVADRTPTQAGCAATPQCSHAYAAPSTGLVLFRFTAKNAVGKGTRYSDGAWHCQPCAPPTNPAQVGMQ